MSVKYFNENRQNWEKVTSLTAKSIHVIDVQGNYEK